MFLTKRRRRVRPEWRQFSHVRIVEGTAETRGATKKVTARSGDVHNYVWDNRRNDWRLVSVDHATGGTTFITEGP